MSDEIKVQSKNKKTKFIIAVSAFVIAVLTIAAIVLVSSNNATAKKVKEQLSLGDKYLSELNYEQAIAAYELAIEIDPKSADAYFGLAEVYEEMGEYDKAIEVLEEAKRFVRDEEVVKRIEERIKEVIVRKQTMLNSKETVTSEPTLRPIVTPEPTNIPVEEISILKYELNNTGTGMVITGVLDRKVKEIIIPETIEDFPVVEIGRSAFNSCTELVHVSLPTSLQRICEYAFFGCTKLSRISLPQGVREIGGCAFLESGLEGLLELPNGLEYIGSGAFDDTHIGSVYLPDSLKDIDGAVFGFTWVMIASENSPAKALVEKSYTGVDFYTEKFGPMLYPEAEVSFLYNMNDDGSNTISIDRLFHGWTEKRIEIPERIDGYKVTAISSYAFMGAEVEEVVVPSSVKMIGACCFNDCQNLKKIVIPVEITEILGGEIFNNSPKVVVVTEEGSEAHRFAMEWGIPVEDYNGNDLSGNTGEFYYHINGAKQWVFDGSEKTWSGAVVTRLNKAKGTTVTIPTELGGEPVVSVAYQAFCECDGITEIILPNTIKCLPERAFAECVTLERIVLPESVEEIGTGVFNNCYNLKEADIRCNISEWQGQELFMGCINLEEVKLPKGIEEIPWSMFFNSGLKTISLPDSVTKIDVQAFAYCQNLTSVTIPSSVKEIDTTAFNGCTQLTIKTPSGSYAEQYAIENGISVQNY